MLLKERERYYFTAGPAMLPLEVLEEAQKEFLNYKGSGISIVELGHRSALCEAMIQETVDLLRSYLAIPNDWAVLFMTGGATQQYSAVPLNLCQSDDSVDYVVTGVWSKQAFKEAQKFCKVNLVYERNPEEKTISPQKNWKTNPNSKYLYYCDNETANGLEFPFVPEVHPGQILVADMTSNFLTRKIDFSKFGVIFAGAQKNAGPSGVTIVLVKKSLLGNARPTCPLMCDYTVFEKFKSAFNTPPVFNIYLTNKVLNYLSKTGGLPLYESLAFEKSLGIYLVIDGSNGFYIPISQGTSRSRMNICFRVKGGKEVEEEFIRKASELKLNDVRGYREVGGIRVSIYNGMPIKALKMLKAFMISFASSNASL